MASFWRRTAAFGATDDLADRVSWDPMSGSRRQVELLAPAGDWESPPRRRRQRGRRRLLRPGRLQRPPAGRQLQASTNSREVLAYLHARNVRGYVAFNTLIFSDELADGRRGTPQAIAAAGADAAIVQDLGLARLIHRMAPTLPIHASTQMTPHRAARHRVRRRHWASSGSSWPANCRWRRSRRLRRADRHAAGGLRPRGAVHLLQRPVPGQRGPLGPQRQPRPVRPGLPAAVRAPRRRPAAALRRPASTC